MNGTQIELIDGGMSEKRVAQLAPHHLCANAHHPNNTPTGGCMNQPAFPSTVELPAGKPYHVSSSLLLSALPETSSLLSSRRVPTTAPPDISSNLL